jgi:hypothetical protein
MSKVDQTIATMRGAIHPRDEGRVRENTTEIRYYEIDNDADISRAHHKTNHDHNKTFDHCDSIRKTWLNPLIMS